MCVYFFNYRVSNHLNTGDLYQQPFRIAFPMVQRCCHNNTSPFQIQGGSNNSREGIGSAERRDQTLAVSSLKTSLTSPLLYRQTALLLFSDACYLVGANEFFQRGPGLKCYISCRIFLLTASKLAECKQGTMIGQTAQLLRACCVQLADITV